MNCAVPVPSPFVVYCRQCVLIRCVCAVRSAWWTTGRERGLVPSTPLHNVHHSGECSPRAPSCPPPRHGPLIERHLYLLVEHDVVLVDAHVGCVRESAHCFYTMFVICSSQSSERAGTSSPVSIGSASDSRTPRSATKTPRLRQVTVSASDLSVSLYVRFFFIFPICP